METAIFRISGMKNEECVRAVANAIQDLPGIGQIVVSLEKGEAHVERLWTPAMKQITERLRTWLKEP